MQARAIWKTIARSATANTLAPLPVFLLGALSIFIQRELGLTPSQLGAAVSAYFAASALSSVPAGHIGERLGAARAMAVGSAVVAIAMLGVAVLAMSYGLLLAWLAFGGLGNAVLQPASNLAIARDVPVHRQGLAFGVKQAAGPGAALLGGLAVPALGLTIGWRWAFVLTGLIAVVFAIAVWRDDRAGGTGTRGARPDSPRATLAVLSLVTVCGAAALNSVGAFYVVLAVTHDGYGEGAAGLWFALGGGGGIVGRVTAGWMLDQRPRDPLVVVAALMAIGGLGTALLGVAGPSAVRALATGLAFAAGWGWGGVFNLAVVRHNPSAPAAATSVSNTGLFIGGSLGPPTFGYLVQHVSPVAAWCAAGAWMTLGAALALLARRLLRTDTRRRVRGYEPLPTDHPLP